MSLGLIGRSLTSAKASKASPPASANISEMGAGRQFETIRAAVDSLSPFLTEHTTILVYPGQYKEDVKISNIHAKTLFSEAFEDKVDETSVMNFRCHDVQAF